MFHGQTGTSDYGCFDTEWQQIPAIRPDEVGGGADETPRNNRIPRRAEDQRRAAEHCCEGNVRLSAEWRVINEQMQQLGLRPHNRGEDVLRNEDSNNTIGGASEIPSVHCDDILDVLWKGINRCYDITETDVIVDGSHIPVNGVKSKLSAPGYCAGGVQNQIQFMVAQLRSPPLPFRVEAYAGNEPDLEQFAHFFPMMMGYLKKGSILIMDNGGAVREILNDIKDLGTEYVTRVKMN